MWINRGNMDTTLQNLVAISTRRIEAADQVFVRSLYHNIEWKSRLILLKGARGVGKTYLMLQHLQKTSQKSVYLTLDHLYFHTHTLIEVVELLYIEGYRTIGLDEVHKYPTWSIELKNLYDSYEDLQLVVTFSSALKIAEGTNDLSRRLDSYLMTGLTFAEYCKYQYNLELPSFTFDQLLKDQLVLYDEIYHAHDIKRKFSSYLKHGYYPFFKEAGRKYHDRLLAVIMQVLDVDMHALLNIDYESNRQIKKLLALLSRLNPYSPNISKLSRDLSLSRVSILNFLDFLAEAGILNILKSGNKSDSSLTKPDKIYFENTNLLYAFDPFNVSSGTLRETFVFNTLKATGHDISTPAKGDFLLDKNYTLEVGGKGKTFHQIHDMPNPVLIKDDIEIGGKDILPMWTLGFLAERWVQ